MEEAVFVASWGGELATNYPQRDEDSVYIIEESGPEKIDLAVNFLTKNG